MAAGRLGGAGGASSSAKSCCSARALAKSPSPAWRCRHARAYGTPARANCCACAPCAKQSGCCCESTRLGSGQRTPKPPHHHHHHHHHYHHPTPLAALATAPQCDRWTATLTRVTHGAHFLFLFIFTRVCMAQHRNGPGRAQSAQALRPDLADTVPRLPHLGARRGCVAGLGDRPPDGHCGHGH